ncbi:hypothetical protein AGR7A_pAt20070 [Agrobacterium deltaense NCPPB 1641]|uniref:Uncharacterized protein n=1 Tax=Agrobacterium deltaense NCPPB 1641 TaxID=1183425 RepID=A0A1S7U8F8_9HYPH|nr:hypothetical protein AGR7A_pAt20070 [Agrobacterium deltaense NCPPB 1641]
MRAQNERITLLRDVHTIDIETKFFRQANRLRITRLKYAGYMGHGLLLLVYTRTYIRRFGSDFKQYTIKINMRFCDTQSMSHSNIKLPVCNVKSGEH